MHTLIFCLTGDGVAHSLYDTLFQQGERELRLITDAELAFAQWLHQADSDGKFFTRIRLSDGFIIEPGMIHKAVNRIPWFQMPHFINPADRQYAQSEMYALYISFLLSIQDKVMDGMPVRLISSGDNAMYFSALAAKAGMPVLDSQFTSSPKWNQPKALSAMDPKKKETVQWHKHSPHLVWENKPVLFNEPFTTLAKIEVVGSNIFSESKLPAQWKQQIRKFSGLTGRTVYEIILAEVNGKYKFYSVNFRPLVLSPAAMDAFSSLLISKKTRK